MINLSLKPQQANWLLAVFKDLPTRGSGEALMLVVTEQALNAAINEANRPRALPPEVEAAGSAPPTPAPAPAPALSDVPADEATEE